MRIGIFGGTFDPFHLGHSDILQSAVDTEYFDEINVIPSFVPPHKNISDISFWTYRYEMARLGLESLREDACVKLNDLEMNLGNKSYTLNTVDRILEDNPGSEIHIICGSDVIFEIPEWHKPKLLLEKAGLFFAQRAGYTNRDYQQTVRFLEKNYDADIRFFECGHLDISSGALREKLENGSDDAKKYLSSKVFDFISLNRIYSRDLSPGMLKTQTFEKLAEYEKELTCKLSKDRLIHSINTARQAAAMAFKAGQNPDKAAIAGILHDCAKYPAAKKDLKKYISRDKFAELDTLYGNVPEEIEHAYLGKVLAENKYGINDREILDSIYYHTTSRKDRTLFEMIIFIADKIEPARRFPRIDEIREISKTSLEQCHKECLKDIIKVLKSKRKLIHEDTLAAYEN